MRIRKNFSPPDNDTVAGSPPLHVLLLGLAPAIAHIITGRVDSPPFDTEARQTRGDRLAPQ